MEGVEEHRTTPVLELLGTLQLHTGTEAPRLSRAGQRVLAHLAVVHRGRAAPRADLAAALWPDLEPDRAAASLRSTLWRLPRPRGRQLVAATATSVRLAEHVAVDLWHAQERAAALLGGRTATDDVAGALPAWERDLLPTWDDDWLVVERESHRQQRLHALERSSWVLCHDGRHGEALSAALTAVSAEPLRESAHRCVIAVHLAEGNQADALRHFDAYRRLLAQDLGIAPTGEVRRMVAHLLGRPLDA